MIMYTLTREGVLKLNSVVVPLDDSTPEYQAYVAWLAEGNGPQMIDDGPVYPSIRVTVWQLIQALSATGMLETVDAAASASSDAMVRLGWQRAPNFQSDDPLILAVCSTLGIDDASRQRVFELAAGL
jgi:hypothetical protein